MGECPVVDQLAWPKERNAYRVAGWNFKGCLFLEKLGALGDGSRGRREEGNAVAWEVGMGQGLADFDRQNES